ncbi:hypothetical protein CTAM01_10115 [Colletotrichum tamarilloi]|uniref:Uncharacterized protein n=1 Tax=Colletotrichum tamarilloi TaxID=1209934 RepID=A0ABQ9R1D5_9PEZI|nr:uncharacterized protein CTAM01_10115 [Colletotrichum tamarilloi]KAK1492058.1 hypothetical protein CTAM01_10115 [Colletotrichum tamarilloi]
MATAMASIRAATSRPIKNVNSFYTDYLHIVKASGEQSGREMNYDEEKQLPSPPQGTTTDEDSEPLTCFDATAIVLVVIWAVFLVTFGAYTFCNVIREPSEQYVLDPDVFNTIAAAVYLLHGALYFCYSTYVGLVFAGPIEGKDKTDSAAEAYAAAQTFSDDDSGGWWWEPCLSAEAIDKLIRIQIAVFIVAFWPVFVVYNFAAAVCHDFKSLTTTGGVDQEIAPRAVCSAGNRAQENQCKGNSEISEKKPLLGQRLTASEIVAIENEAAAAEVWRMYKARMVEQKSYAPAVQR